MYRRWSMPCARARVRAQGTPLGRIFHTRRALSASVLERQLVSHLAQQRRSPVALGDDQLVLR